MTLSIIVTILSILGMLILLLFIPKITIHGHSFSTFYLAPLLGLIILLISGVLPFNDFYSGLTKDSKMNPLEILVLFFSMTFISSVLDKLNFFSYLANKMVLKAKNSQKSLFFFLYGLCGFLTMFTSNDIVIITFTPFILFFAKDTKINPIPYLFCEFVAANTWSMLFIFGNPTNVYLASTFNVDFISYFLKMALPTLFASLTSLFIMYLLFFKMLKEKLNTEVNNETIKDKPIFIISLSILIIVIILMAISSYLNLPMWLFAGVGGIILFLIILISSIIKKEKPTLLFNSLKGLPFTLAPFLLSMFGIVMSLSLTGISEKFVTILLKFDQVWSYGISSFIFSNIINNLPMSVFFSDLLVLGKANELSLYAVIISSNLGAILTPLGALAGMMWMSILKEHNVSFSYGKFCLYGSIISIPTFLMALVPLFLF